MAKDKKKPETKQETPPFPSREAAMEALEKSTLSDAEKARLMQKNGSTITVANLPPDEVVRGNPETSPKSGAELATLEAGVLRQEAIVREPLAPVADAVARLGNEAKRGDPDAQLGGAAAMSSDVVRGDALLASMGDAAKRLESLANLPPDLQAVAQRITAPGETLVQAVERLEALARAVSAPAVGLIVQETAPSMYKVHVVESDAEGVRVWDTEPGKAMPWHAAKVLVDRVVETKLTPEDKR